MLGKIEALEDKVKEMDNLRLRNLQLEEALEEIKKLLDDDINKSNTVDKSKMQLTISNSQIRMKRENVLPILKCEMCDKKFPQLCNLEYHMKREHETQEELECDKCRKKFVTEWRLTRHRLMHFDNNIKKCYYFNNSKLCPFEELGCKFLHILSEKCKFYETCRKRMCSLKHSSDNKVYKKNSGNIENKMDKVNKKKKDIAENNVDMKKKDTFEITVDMRKEDIIENKMDRKENEIDKKEMNIEEATKIFCYLDETDEPNQEELFYTSTPRKSTLNVKIAWTNYSFLSV